MKNDFAGMVEEAQGEPLTQEDYNEIQLWENGKELLSIVSTPGWEIALNTLESFRESATEQLLEVLPGDTDRILAAHAVAFAAASINQNFRNAIQTAVEAAKTTPEVLKRGLKRL